MDGGRVAVGKLSNNDRLERCMEVYSKDGQRKDSALV